MTSVVTLMAAALDAELRSRGIQLPRTECDHILRIVINGTAAIAHDYESSLPARMPPSGGASTADAGPQTASAVTLMEVPVPPLSVCGDQEPIPSSADLAPLRTSDGGRTPSGAAPAVTPAIRAGDIVHHEPSGEDWVVAYVDGDDLAWCGWPAGEARLSDCRLMKPCSDAEHLDWLRQLAKSDGDRVRHARLALAALGVSETAPAAPEADMP